MLTPAEIDALFRHARRYRPTAVVSARQLPDPLVWRTSRGADLRAEAGDWELIDDDGDRWTVAPEAFTRSYQRRPDGRYAKLEIIEAVRLQHPVEVATHEGPSSADSGDWLLRDAEGAVWPTTDQTFRRRYSPTGSRAGD
jgi:hypothetical protein